jgi:hypothetical protein
MKKFLQLIPGIGGQFDDSGKQALEALSTMQKRLEGISLPELQQMVAEEYQSAGDYAPEQSLYQTVGEDPRLRSSQMSALEKLSGLAETGLSSEDALSLMNAREMGSQMARANTQASLQNAQARGVAGSGLEFAMREMGGQEAAGRAQRAAMEEGAQAARQRAMYTQAFMDSTGQVRQQDASVNKTNADIINQFNQANTNARNQAQQLNLQNRQGLMNSNVDARKDAFKYNNDIRQKGFDNNITKVTGQNAASQGIANHHYAQNAANQGDRNMIAQMAMSAMAPTPKAPKKEQE